MPFTMFTILNAALPSYQAIPPCALHSELWCYVSMANWSKPKKNLSASGSTRSRILGQQ